MARSGTDPYRGVARWYDRIFGGMNAGLRGIGLKMLPPHEAMDVLDVGCGTGLQLVAYRDAGCRVFGVDASPAMLEMARRQLGERASLQLGDATHMPYADGAFDLVLATTVLHEMAPDVRAATLSEARRVLRDDGRMLLTDFEPGKVRPIRGWIARTVIGISERAAGRAHRRNYRDFMRHGGLAALLEAERFSVERRKIVSGGAIGIYLARRRDTAGAEVSTWERRGASTRS